MPATTFDKPMFPGTKYVKKTITVSNTSGSYSETFYDERITGGLEAARLEIANPEVLDADPHIICYNGYFVFNCDDVEGTTTIKIYFLKVTDDPTAVTSSEFDILNNRITAIENVESRFNITISPSDFSVSAPFTYTWLNSAIKTNSSVKVEFGDGDVDELFGILGVEKVTGGIQFEADILPEDDIQVTIKVMNAGGINAVEVTGEEVATSVISGAANVDEALTALDSKIPIFSNDLQYQLSSPISINPGAYYECPIDGIYSFRLNANNSGVEAYICLDGTNQDNTILASTSNGTYIVASFACKAGTKIYTRNRSGQTYSLVNYYPL